jgi:transposase
VDIRTSGLDEGVIGDQRRSIILLRTELDPIPERPTACALKDCATKCMTSPLCCGAPSPRDPSSSGGCVAILWRPQSQPAKGPPPIVHLFTEHDFFDPHDMVQLKYETIRAVDVDGRPIAEASVDFGLSRPTIYEAQENFRQEGFGGLLPQKRGPKKARKLTPEVRLYLEELVVSEPDLKAPALAARVRRRFGIVIHPRTVEKALVKKGRQRP